MASLQPPPPAVAVVSPSARTSLPTIRVLLVDDHAVVHESLRCLIDATPDLRVVSEVRDAAMTQSETAATRPDVIVIDLSVDHSALHLSRELRRANSSASLLIVTDSEQPAHVHEMFAAGALGYVRRQRLSTSALVGIRVVASGQRYLDTPLYPLQSATSNRRAANQATSRETDVLRLCAQGYTHKAIGALLGIAEKTVETHKFNAMRKLDLSNRIDLIRHAASHGWLRLPSAHE